MIANRVLAQLRAQRRSGPYLGTPGRLGILIWSLLLILFAHQERFLLVAGLTLALNGLLYPVAIKRLFHWRWLLFAALLILPNLWWGGAGSWLVGLLNGLQMVVRALVVLLAVDGFTSAVDIAEVAGLFERIGLPGLGFSMGVAVNLLPAFRHSSQCTWRSLRMRGGLRRRWWRGLQLLLVTIVTNALRRAEEIALAAETRAFSPGRGQTLPLRRGLLDWMLIILLAVTGFLVVANLIP
jgi:energy-coupling factor transporter transmembrane protein EcfT